MILEDSEQDPQFRQLVIDVFNQLHDLSDDERATFIFELGRHFCLHCGQMIYLPCYCTRDD